MTMAELAPKACVARGHQDHYHPRGWEEDHYLVAPAPSNYGRSLYMERLARADVADPEVKAATAWLKSGGTGTYRSAP